MKSFLISLYILLLGISYGFSQSNDGVIVKRIGYKKIVVDSLGHEIIGRKHSYQRIEENFPYDHVLWIKKNNKWAFFNLKGKPLTPFIFDDMHPANICSYQPNLWFGKDIRWFYKGLIVVEKNNQFAILNKKMEYVVPWKTYDWISSMNKEGLMIVKKNNKFGLLNYQLKLIQKINFDTISNLPKQRHEQNYPSFWARKNSKYFILDTLGYWKDSIEYDNIELLQDNFYLVTKDDKKWRLDRNGTRIIEDFEVVRDDENGFVARKNGKLGLVYDGEIILPFEYEDIISEHLGNIFVKKNGKWGLVDEDNTQLLSCKYDYIAYAWDRNNNDERNYIVVQDDKFGKVTKTGKEIFPCKYDGITTWVEYGPDGHYVMIDNRMGLINYKGKVLIPIKYDKVQDIAGTSWALIYDKGKMGIYSFYKKSFFLPIEYDYIYIDKDPFMFKTKKPTRIITYKNGIVNILDEKGKKLQSNVSKMEIKKKFDIDIDAYQYSPCSYELLLMVHNRTYQIPDCLKKTIKGSVMESVFYKEIMNNK